MNEDIDVVEVRRQGRLALIVAVAALAVAIAFVWRGGVAGYLVGALMLLVAVAQGWTAYDSRLPLLLVDEQGVRLRFGQAWRGFPWSAVETVEHTPRPTGFDRLWKDGRIGVLLRDEDAAVHDLTSSARRQALLTERLYGVPFAVPLGLSTRVLGAGENLTLAIAALAPQEVEVAEIDPTMAEVAEVPEDAPEGGPARVSDHLNDETEDHSSAAPAEETAERPTATPAGDTNPRMPRVDDNDETNDDNDETTDDDPEAPAAAADESPSPMRETSTAVRADVRIEPKDEPTVAVHGANALKLDPAEEESDEGGFDWLNRRTAAAGRAAEKELPPVPALPQLPDGVSPISKPGRPVEALDVDDFGLRPADNPVVGPEIAAARTRLGLSVDALAEWTRIRPHVIEGIEVDDFGPCGGDFYARGHLRTLARVLAIEVAPLLEAYDERYASGPVSPRAVFSAELARGDSSRPLARAGRGGPSWSVLVAAVMAVVLVWSVARLVIDSTHHPKNDAAIQLDGSAGTGDPYGKVSGPVPVTVSAAGGGAHVVVRDAKGKVAFTGDLAFGESKTLKVAPPLRVQTSDGSLTVAVGGGKGQPLGKTGQAAQRTYTAH